MRTKTAFLKPACLLLAAWLVGCRPTPPPPPVTAACVDFEAPLSVGTQYGAPAGQKPGDSAFTTAGGIRATVWEFDFTNGGNAFNLAEVESTAVPSGSGQSLRSNNLNLEFDFSQVGFKPAQVDLVFLDKGGFENLSVNGSQVYAGDLTKIPTTLGGVNLSVSAGTLTLQGAVTTLRVGGQEFWIDDVCAQK